MNHNASVLELSNLTVIKASGTDAIHFLNDQFSNDIALLEPARWQFNGYCTAKGRLIAITRLFKDSEDIYFILPKGISEVVLKRLQIYVFRAKVNFETLNETKVHALINMDLTNQMDAMEPWEVRSDEDGFLLNLSTDQDRLLIIGELPEWISNPEPLSGDKAEQYWRLSEIQQSIPSVYPETSGKFIPQHVNMDEIDAISFKKGCFPGQEVIARLHYLGKSKKSMRQIHTASDTPLSPGDTISQADTGKVLTIVDAVETAHQSYDCLVVGQFD